VKKTFLPRNRDELLIEQYGDLKAECGDRKPEDKINRIGKLSNGDRLPSDEAATRILQCHTHIPSNKI